MKLKLPISIFCIVICSKSFSQWNTNPALNEAVCASANDQKDVAIESDTKSGAIITWVDYRNNPVASDIYAQRLNAAGLPLWTINGIAVCSDPAKQTGVAVNKSGGGVIMAWQDWRSGNQDIYAQKVDSTGAALWTNNGFPVCVKVNDQNNPKIIGDGAGGAIITWQDSSGTSDDIYAQRISSVGVAMWAPGGVIVCNAQGPQINPKLKTDGLGGAIITWQDKRTGSEYDIYAQRINGLGAAQWAANGVVVCNSIGNQTNQKVESDGQNGVYITWQDKRSGLAYDIYAQRINSTGTPQWTPNGVVVCNAQLSQNSIDMTSNNVNGVIVSWKDERSGSNKIYTQLITPAGIPQWTANGIEIAPGINPNIVSDDAGGGIIAWQDSTISGGTWNVYSQRLSAAGIKLWNTPSVPVASASGGQFSPKNIPDGNGGSIYAWEDKRNTLDLDIYAHRLSADGSVVTLQEIKKSGYEITCSPNPFNAQTTITVRYLNTLHTWALNIYDITGEKVTSKIVQNSNAVTIEKNNLQNGIYFYRAINKDQVIGYGKFIITD